MTTETNLTAQGLYAPNHIGSAAPDTSNVIWSQITSSNKSAYIPTEVLLNKIEKLELQNKFLSLSILRLEGKFTQEEVKHQLF
jgi:hypothetical protein